MAKFQLALLISNGDSYLEDVFTSFNYDLDNSLNVLSKWEDTYDLDKYMSNYNKTIKTNRNFSYSYDENLTLGENSQNKLTFKMLKYIEHDGRYDVNPFAAIISGGSQIKLTDKDNQVYIFTVTSPKYAIKRSNVEITYECVDSFSYKNTRQNSGYTISNDETSEDFIGSKTLDEWATKIHDECKIKYDYIPTNHYIWIEKPKPESSTETGTSQDGTGTSQDGTGTSQDGTGTSQDGTNKLKIGHGETLSATENYTIDRVLREPLDPDYNPALVFSISNSNALNANITLANDNGLVIKVNDQYKAYYFIPQKNPEFSGLYYSPQVDVKSLDISQDAASLTTLLNVTGPTFDDSEVTLIPTITDFFYDLFSRNEWGDISLVDSGSTKKGDIIDKQPSETDPAVPHLSYADGMFEKLITERTLSFYNISKITLGMETVDKKEVIKYIDIPLGKENSDETFSYETIPNFYSNFKVASSSYFEDEKGGNHYFSNSDFKYHLVHKKIGENKNEIDDYELGANFVIDGDKTMENRNDKVYLRIRPIEESSFISINLTSVPFLQITFYRHNTREDFEFAKAADRIPWLENKLINFEYFLRKGILTEEQYQDLLKLIKENLRIANGYLLFYRKQYYDSLRQKTAYLANLDAMIDNYFAHFEDGIISHYQNGEAISNFIGIDKASSLTEAALKEIYYQANPGSTIPMISADVTIGSTMTSYFNAQQNFLKNIYLFRKFWNTKCNIEAAKEDNWTNGQWYVLVKFIKEIKTKDGKTKNYTQYDNLAFASMQAELTNYWDQAYHSSRFCDYFLPEYWNNPFGKEGADNKYLFTTKIVKADINAEITESDIRTQIAKLDNIYIPIVEIYSEISEDPETSEKVEIDQFPVYTFKYDETQTTTDKLLAKRKPIFEDIFYPEARIFKKVSQQNSNEENSSQQDSNQQDLSQEDSSQQKPTQRDHIVINENKKLYKNYYIVTEGGKKWNELVEFWLNDKEFPTWFTTPVGAGNEYDSRFTETNEWTPTKYVFGGIYPIMLYKLLHEVRLDTVEEYDKAQKKHDAVWNRIYNTYGNAILENSYSNSTAVNAEELYIAASNYFKDKAAPEKQYNISVIDIYSLKGYNNQKIQVTDQIRLAGQDFYDEMDELKDLINQPLFVSEISYSLRSDGDIKLTVNTIKYQDKLIRKLVSLIK